MQCEPLRHQRPPKAMNLVFMYSWMPCAPSRPARGDERVHRRAEASAHTDATLLDTTEWNDGLRNQAGVATDHANLQLYKPSQSRSMRRWKHTYRLCHSPYPADITRIEVAGKADIRVVREGDNLFLGLEPDERCHRPECLLRGDHCVRRHISKNSRGVERACALEALATVKDGSTSLDSVGNVLLNLLQCFCVDQRPMRPDALSAGDTTGRLRALTSLGPSHRQPRTWTPCRRASRRTRRR
jgi:hypothetical protein